MSGDCFSETDTIHILLPTNDCLVNAHVPTDPLAADTFVLHERAK
jgi:hypothetical protein